MSDMNFVFQSFSEVDCKDNIEAYLKQHNNKDKFKTYKNSFTKDFISIPEATTIVFGNSNESNRQKLYYTLKYNENLYQSLGLLSLKPDKITQEFCEKLYNTYMVATIQIINLKVLFYLLLQYDAGFVRYVTTKDEYAYLMKVFKSDFPTFNTATRLKKLLMVTA